MSSVDELIGRLQAINEELNDLAITRLRDGIEGDTSASGDEKVISRAMRSVDKTVHLLQGLRREEL